MTPMIDGETPFATDELKLADYLGILRRRWWLVVATALLLALAAFVYSMLQPRVYRAEADVLLRTNTSENLFPQVPRTQDLSVLRIPNAEVDYVESDAFQRVLADNGVDDTIAYDVPDISDGDSVRAGNKLRFIVTGGSAESVADSANEAAALYVESRHARDLNDYELGHEAEIARLAEAEAELNILLGPENELLARIAETSDADEESRLRSDLADIRARNVSAKLQAEQDVSNFGQRVEESLEVRSVLANSNVSASVNSLADAPNSPISPKTSRNLALGAVLGLLGGLGLALLWESADDKVKAEDDITALGVNLLTSVPADGKKVEGQRLFVRDPDSTGPLEAYRTARASLNFATEGGLSSFLVTSGLPGEGKSTTCANLGVALSMAGQKTLIIDADMRRPTMHKFFEVPNNIGLGSVLRDEVDANDVVSVTGYGEMLAVMPAGSGVVNPSELLANGRLETLVANACEAYDVVIVDTPPIFLVSDAAIVAPAVGGVVVSVTTGMGDTGASKKSDTRRLVGAVSKLRIPVLGVVLHGGGVGSYGYSYKYGYYGESTNPEPAQVAAAARSGAIPANGSVPVSRNGHAVTNGSTPLPDEGWVEDNFDIAGGRGQ